MIQQRLAAEYEPALRISDYSLVEKLGDAALLGKWFVFLKPEWLTRSGMEQLLQLSGMATAPAQPAILFRGKDTLTLPGATLSPTPLPQAQLVSLTSDKTLYRAHHDTIRLLIAAPQHPGAVWKLRLRLSGSDYADYPLALDDSGLCLWSLRDLPEGQYEASIVGIEIDACRFEVAEYRLAPLNAELVEQQLSGQVLRYVLGVTAFGRPYTGPVEVELHERDTRIGQRDKLVCNREGQCRGAVKLSGAGPYTLHLFAGERTASVALKGSEQQRRETLTISELGEAREISLLPLPQSNVCRGIYIARGGSNNEPFLARRVVGSEVEITARAQVELLKAVVINPSRAAMDEYTFQHLVPDQSVRLPVSAPYGIVLLGAFIEGSAWEGWCAVLHPSELQLQCQAPKEAKPGERVTITLATGASERAVPVQLIVKDARLIAASDPQVELAAAMKKNLTTWRGQSITGQVVRSLSACAPPPPPVMRPRVMAMPTMAMPFAPVVSAPQFQAIASAPTGALSVRETASFETAAAPQERGPGVVLANVRLAFPEVVYNNLLRVQGETRVEVKLGDSMTRYSIEAFALDAAAMDWQRVETSIETTRPVYGELTVSPFVFPGDPVMGRLDVGAASGGAIVEVRHDDEILPLFHEDGSEVTPGLPVPSGSTLHFPVRPGVITSSVRDARKGGIDVSERYVTEPGRLRHIARRVRLLLPGDAITLADEPRALELKPLPALERPFQLFVESAVKYPFGCIEQTSSKLLAMCTGYIVNMASPEVAREYEAALLAWHKRLKSMALPGGAFCMYPPEEGGARTPDTHYAPRGIQHLMKLPAPDRSGITSQAVLEILRDVTALANAGARYYKLESVPQSIKDCHDAYQVALRSENPTQRAKAASFARQRLKEHDGQTYVETGQEDAATHLFGVAVARRQETAYAAATLLAAGDESDLRAVIAATNYITGQLNEQGRLYSTVDTAAGLGLLLGLREKGIVTTAEHGRVEINGTSFTLSDALAFPEKILSLRCIEGVTAVEVTSEVIEDWSALQSTLPVEVRLEQHGRARARVKVGEELDLVIRVPRYEPGLIAHVCLPDALARITGGGQVKRFSLDFCEKAELRVPLAAITTTRLPGLKLPETEHRLLRLLGMHGRRVDEQHTQRWAVIVRNMFKEEQIGNPGLLNVIVDP